MFSEEQRSSGTEWSLPKWLLPVKASSRKHQLTQVHFTWAGLFCLLRFRFLELIAQGYDGEDTKGHFSQAPERNGFYKMDGAKQGKALMNILCFGQLNKTHITKITINHLHEFKLLPKPYMLHYPPHGLLSSGTKNNSAQLSSTYYRTINPCSFFLVIEGFLTLTSLF